jgi:predicted kinase
VILDATYAKREWREQARAWAASQASACSLVVVTADEQVALARLHERARRGADASDAGPELYAAMRAEFEDPLGSASAWPLHKRFVIDTSAGAWHEAARKVAAALTADAAR